MGLFEIPQVKRSPDGILYLVLGIVLGGLGILISGLVAGHRNSVWVGLIMIVATLAFGLGWVWAIVWGIIVFVRST